MVNKKTKVAVLSIVAVLLVVALLFSLMAVMGAYDNVYEGTGGNIGTGTRL